MLIDQFNRKITYLRISVTKECNFRCLYCMPKIPFNAKINQDLLSLDELFLFAKAIIDKGIEKIRITGGEPLLRQDLPNFIHKLSSCNKNLDLSLSTNAFLLYDYAEELKESGLKRLNISLDTLDNKKAKKIAQKNVLEQVLKGLDKALKLNFKIKLNCVALKNFNDDELINLLEFAKEKKLEIRFIEFMENTHAYGSLKGLKKEEIIKILAQKYKISFVQKSLNSPMSSYLADDYHFGIIDPHSDEFCSNCNRIRLSADGLLIPCLYFEQASSIKQALKEKNIKLALEILSYVLQNKPEKNKWGLKNNEISQRAFFQTGG